MSVNATPKLAVVIPTLNEAGNIPVLLDRLSAAIANAPVDCEFIIVDDGSTDGTADVARACAAHDPRVRVFVRNGERGLAGAVIHGWAQTDATFLAVIDADLQHPPELLPELLFRVLNGSDIAIASRYVSGNGNSLGEWNKFRIFVSRCSTLLATAPLRGRGLNVKDPLSGYFVVRRDCIEALRLQPEGFKILLEILVKGRIRNATEVPFHFATRQSGKSKADFKVALHYFTLLGKLSRYAFFGQGQQ
ncbi:MAG TPA: polyprenol monophosphomannose synthase [Terriglobales bacterium]|nr:polyprenol monophosphomannose synthase [Terriglobales bacterium]